MENPYLDELNEKFDYCETSVGSTSGFDRHTNEEYTIWDMRLKYSFAIPNEEAIEEIVKYSPLIEIGAGSGYWAYLINKKGGDIITFDNKRREYDKYWYNVNYGNTNKVKEYPERTLFLCWPENEDSMGFDSIKNSISETVILIGEKNGCTGSKGMDSLLRRNYTLEKHISIPQWMCNRDRLTIYSKN